MKIIGNTAGGYMVDVNANELANIMGHDSNYSFERSGSPKLSIGSEIKVSKLFEALSVSRGRKKDIADLAEALRKVAGRVDTINQALAAPIIEVEVKP